MAARSATQEVIDEARLRSTLGQLLRDTLQREVHVVSLQRTPSEFATLFPADVVHLVLDDGTRLQIFLKHLGTSDHPEKDNSEKEVRVYRDLLSREGLPVPRYYGSSWNAETERYELYLEYIDDWCLKYHPIEDWYVAAGELARFHAAFAGRVKELRACGVLPMLDELYCWSLAKRAREEVVRHSPSLVGRLDKVLTRYDRIVRSLIEAPPTLVNYDLSTKNVLADRSCRPTRICLVDWESAVIGCGVLDIVHLAYGLEDGPWRTMIDTYFEGLEGTPLAPATPSEAECLVAASEAHKAMYRLARCNYRKYTAETVEALVAYAERFCERLGATNLRRSI